MKYTNNWNSVKFKNEVLVKIRLSKFLYFVYFIQTHVQIFTIFIRNLNKKNHWKTLLKQNLQEKKFINKNTVENKQHDEF